MPTNSIVTLWKVYDAWGLNSMQLLEFYESKLPEMMDLCNMLHHANHAAYTTYAAPSIWNKLPLEIYNSSPFASFKRNLSGPP